jgi:ferredoxin-type protein NapF
MNPRRQFLRGQSRAAPPLRPPHALAEDAFVASCTRCDACVSVCPTGILQRGDGGFPETNFSRGECTFCDACRKACTPGALAADGPAWTLQLAIEAGCIAQANVVCRSCGDRCDVRAIRFPPRRGAAAVPVVDEALCNHCGACISACPVAAIRLRPETAAEAIA